MCLCSRDHRIMSGKKNWFKSAATSFHLLYFLRPFNEAPINGNGLTQYCAAIQCVSGSTGLFVCFIFHQSVALQETGSSVQIQMNVFDVTVFAEFLLYVVLLGFFVNRCHKQNPTFHRWNGICFVIVALTLWPTVQFDHNVRNMKLTSLWSGFQFIIVIVSYSLVVLYWFSGCAFVAETTAFALSHFFLKTNNSFCKLSNFVSQSNKYPKLNEERRDWK